MNRRRNDFLFRDLLIIAGSLGVAWALVKTNILYDLLASVRGIEFIGSFIAGLFFTSVFTTAPAIITLGEIARFDGIFPVALLGAVGATLGDLLIFRFMRDRFSAHILELVSHRGLGKRLRTMFALKLFRALSFFIGGLILASPLPDELGVGLLGFSKVKFAWFIPLSLFFNFVGIVAISIVARAI